MITEKTAAMVRYGELLKLIEALEPIAAKYKAPRMADSALDAIGWHYSLSGHTRFYKHIKVNYPDSRNRGLNIDSEFFEIYDYGQKYSTLPEMLDFLKRALTRYKPTHDPSIYSGDLIRYVNNAIGEAKEYTADEFEIAKRKTLAQLRAAVLWVEGSTDCRSAEYSAFDGPDST